MGTTLTGTTPQDTYDSLIKVTDNGPLSGTAKYLSDGLGNDSALALSTSNVGVGTTTTTYDSAKIGTSHRFLSIQSNAGAYAVGTLAGSQSGNGDRLGYLTFVNANNSASYKYSAWIGSEVEGTTANQQGGRLIFSTTADASAAGPIERLRITSTGNVGIGTSAPASRLVVVSDDPSQVSIEASTGNVNSQINLKPSGTGIAYIKNQANTDFAFGTNNTERMRITAAGNVAIGTTFEAGKLTVEQPSAARVATLIGNSNSQGFAQNHRVVRHYPVVSLGTKLIIPFVSQGNLNSNTIVRVFGHSARYNSTAALAFTADFSVGHLTSIQASATLSSTGNVASIASNGASAMEITFTSAYTAATSDGVFVTIEYMTNNINYSIDVANIAMN